MRTNGIASFLAGSTQLIHAKEGGDIIVVNSMSLIMRLLKADKIDRLDLLIVPEY
jgi:dihydrofolate reductase